jgi:hypothetical protein
MIFIVLMVKVQIKQLLQLWKSVNQLNRQSQICDPKIKLLQAHIQYFPDLFLRHGLIRLARKYQDALS